MTSTTTSTSTPGGGADAAHGPGPVRRWVVRYPLASFTTLVLGIGWPVLAVPALSAHGVLPGGTLPVEPFVFAAVWLVMLPAALGVTAAVDGRAGVRTLLARAFRWRFGAGWWAAVALGLPVTTVVLGLATGRALHLADAGTVALDALVSVLSALVLVNLWEETVWAGFLQTRLEQRHGSWPAAVLTAVAFAGIHVPLQFTGEVTAVAVAVGIATLFAVGLLVRVVVGVVLAGTGGSVLAVAVLHAVFNATTAEGDLADRLLSGANPLAPALAATVVVAAVAAAAGRGSPRSAA